MVDKEKLKKAVEKDFPENKHKKIIEKAVRKVLEEEKRKEDEELGRSVAATD